MPPANGPPSHWSRLIRGLGIVLLVAAIYDGTVFYSRWSERQDADKARAAREAEQARKTVEAMGGDGVKILEFYASPGAIRPGGTATLCYAVNGASTVRLDPPIAPVWPSLTRCFPATPVRETEYKLTAADPSGHEVSQTLSLKIVK